MRQYIKQLFPRLIPIVRWLRGDLSDSKLLGRITHECAGCVAAGPFRGMKYIGQSNGSALMPKLLGTYEHELHGVIEEITKCAYVRVIDVGSAEGYYAVGLALRMPWLIVEAYDIDGHARRNLARLADLNGVSGRIVIGEEWRDEDIVAHVGRHCLVICDIEGAERVLLDPIRCPALVDYDILVEMHDGDASTEIHDLLTTRFADSHEHQFIRYRGRSWRDASYVRSLFGRRNKVRVVEERRSLGLEWGWFRARRWMRLEI